MNDEPPPKYCEHMKEDTVLNRRDLMNEDLSNIEYDDDDNDISDCDDDSDISDCDDDNCHHEEELHTLRRQLHTLRQQQDVRSGIIRSVITMAILYLI